MPCHYCGAASGGSTPIIELTGRVRPGCCAAVRAVSGSGLPPGYAPGVARPRMAACRLVGVAAPVHRDGAGG